MDSIPESILAQLKRFHESLSDVEDVLQPHLNASFESHLQRPPIDKARVDLMTLFAINSLCWIYLCTEGKNPKENEALTNELKRTKTYMQRLKEVQEQCLAPKVNVSVAAKFIRNALWETPNNEEGNASREDEEMQMGREREEEMQPSRERDHGDSGASRKRRAGDAISGEEKKQRVSW